LIAINTAMAGAGHTQRPAGIGGIRGHAFLSDNRQDTPRDAFQTTTRFQDDTTT
jgi:hypothetical protein